MKKQISVHWLDFSKLLLAQFRRLRDNLNLPHWRTHDFRRSISTTCSELGTMPHVTEKMLGHELVGVMAIYNKHDWLSDQKEAYAKFADALFVQVQKELEHEKVAVR
ncbi:tyrosine-type recombinase/integrase [Vibrio sp.]|uniref:tyrosine-type recombinase/integrase n=1 Tax=Vibrio sp. TaxID=678 RepID=UPI003AA9D16D